MPPGTYPGPTRLEKSARKHQEVRTEQGGDIRLFPACSPGNQWVFAFGLHCFTLRHLPDPLADPPDRLTPAGWQRDVGDRWAEHVRLGFARLAAAHSRASRTYWVSGAMLAIS